ncbi:MAG: T9SS type A sorting domain-containing protein [Bacteroidetes bacterium]|jgi:hypothetical protein|nr:T9SS type A sorting domain-containing protein [Bacteroidota bacterium]MBT6686101.1 T9SS type A sorting domain-containing protein [Bacteroidota bacterium]MBT7142006.1 T9SS type A sorting domain-containing protein [Bacteroidota bacterium]MBT7490117.1 T9SS type A sorting domain-containing protein [Bacteroidota bacterium]
MRSFFYKYLIFLFIFFAGKLSFSQNPWAFNITGSNHTILVQSTTPITIDGNQIVPGDYIGVFYDSLGSLSCAGYLMWTGSGNTTIAAWGSENGFINGFSQGEEFKWKIWRAYDGTVFSAEASFMQFPFPNTGFYEINGTSGLESLVAISSNFSPDWNLTNTGIVHSILVPDSCDISINNIQIASGDYLGVFYDSLGTLSCAGYIEWTGISDTLEVFGSAIGQTNGFASNELFKWKIWQAANNFELEAEAEYLISKNYDSSLFLPNGFSYLMNLEAFTGADLSVFGLVQPVSGCENSSDNQVITVEVFNSGDTIASNFSLKYSVNGGSFITETPQQIINIGENLIYSFTQTSDFSVIGQYIIVVEVEMQADQNFQNNVFEATVNNFEIPDVEILNLDSNFCSDSTQIVELVAIPNGGIFSGNGILGTTFFPSNAGNFEIIYSYTDPVSYCFSADTQEITVFQSPQVSLGSNQSLCAGDTLVLAVDSGFAEYIWSVPNSSTNFLSVLNSGIYYITVIDQNSCSGNSDVNIIFNPLPEVSIAGYSNACEGDTVTLSVEDNFQLYNWGDSTNLFSSTFNVSQTGLYSVTVTNLGCEAFDNHYIQFYPKSEIEIYGESQACEGDKLTLVASYGFIYYEWSQGNLFSSQSIDVNSTGIYSVTATDSNACKSVSSLEVVFNPIPDVGLINLSDTCEGDTITLISDKADFYLWSTGSTDRAIVALETGYYSVTIISKNCSNSDKIYLNFITAPLADFSFEKNINEVSFFNNSTISSNYLWNFGDGENSIFFNPVHTYQNIGNYKVILKIENQCGTSEVSELINIEDTVAFSAFKSFEVSPNPGNGLFFLNFEMHENIPIEIFVYSAQGKQVYKNALLLKKGKFTYELNLNSCQSGVYFIEINSGDGKLKKQIVKT